MLEDYIFFAKAYKYPASEVDRLPWSYRKEMKQFYQDYVLNKQK